MTRVRESLLPWKSNKYYIFVCVCVHACSLAYPARHAYAPYCDVICGPSGSIIFFDIISKTARFSEKVIEHKMCVLILSTTLSDFNETWNSYFIVASHLCLGLPGGLLLVFNHTFTCISLLPHACYMYRSFHLLNHMQHGVQFSTAPVSPSQHSPLPYN